MIVFDGSTHKMAMRNDSGDWVTYNTPKTDMTEVFIPYCQVVGSSNELLKWTLTTTETVPPPKKGIPWNPRKSKRRR